MTSDLEILSLELYRYQPLCFQGKNPSDAVMFVLSKQQCRQLTAMSDADFISTQISYLCYRSNSLMMSVLWLI